MPPTGARSSVSAEGISDYSCTNCKSTFYKITNGFFFFLTRTALLLETKKKELRAGGRNYCSTTF